MPRSAEILGESNHPGATMRLSMNFSRRMPNLGPAAAWASLLLCLGILAACAKTVPFRGEVVDPPTPAPSIVGTNWNGDAFDLGQLQGKVVVLFFGYTLCPDVCPFTLAKLKKVKAELGSAAADLAVVFVSVDPHRDSVHKLAHYVPNFDPSFYGVHLEPHDLDLLSDSFGLTVQYGQPKDGPGTDSFYYVDHTGTYFVFDRQGRLRLKHPPSAKAEDLLPDLQALLAS
jgi:protein SCO1/2